MLKSAPSLLLAGALNACAPGSPPGSESIDPILLEALDSFNEIAMSATTEDPKVAEFEDLSAQLKIDLDPILSSMEGTQCIYLRWYYPVDMHSSFTPRIEFSIPGKDSWAREKHTPYFLGDGINWEKSYHGYKCATDFVNVYMGLQN